MSVSFLKPFSKYFPFTIIASLMLALLPSISLAENSSNTGVGVFQEVSCNFTPCFITFKKEDGNTDNIRIPYVDDYDELLKLLRQLPKDRLIRYAWFVKDKRTGERYITGDFKDLGEAPEEYKTIPAVSAIALFNDFSTNELAASKYYTKDIAVRGTAVSIQRVRSDIQLTLYGGKGPVGTFDVDRMFDLDEQLGIADGPYFPVYITLDNSQEDTAVKIRKGSSVTVKCNRYDFMGNQVVGAGCSILQTRTLKLF